MPEPGSHHAPTIPVSYRNALAISLAFMVTIFLLAGLPSPLKEAQDLSQRLVFKLSSPAAQPDVARAPAEDSPPETRIPEVTVEPWRSIVVTTAADAP